MYGHRTDVNKLDCLVDAGFTYTDPEITQMKDKTVLNQPKIIDRTF